MALEKWGKAVKIAGGLSLGMAVFSAGAYQGLKSTRPVCFIAGTMILTAAGYLAIEKIKKGDLVISTNEKTLETKKKSVVETYIRETMHLIHLTINKEVISTTKNHPFYVLGKGFTEAGEIQPGDQVINAAGEPFVGEEKRIEFVKEPVRVYNFQVGEFHTYHVGELGVWVHNADYAPGDGLDSLIKDGKISIDDIAANPNAFRGKLADEIAQVLKNSGYDVTVKISAKSKSGAQIIQINNPGSGKNISQVQVSPGGGRHGGNSYVKVSTTDQGIVKIVNGLESFYKTDGKESATIIFSGGK